MTEKGWTSNAGARRKNGHREGLPPSLGAHREVIRALLDVLERELALFEVVAEGELRSRVIEVASVFRGRVVALCPETMVIEVSGIPEEIDAVRELLGDFGLRRMVRSGPVAIGSGAEGLR